MSAIERKSRHRSETSACRLIPIGDIGGDFGGYLPASHRGPRCKGASPADLRRAAQSFGGIPWRRGNSLLKSSLASKFSLALCGRVSLRHTKLATGILADAVKVGGDHGNGFPRSTNVFIQSITLRCNGSRGFVRHGDIQRCTGR